MMIKNLFSLFILFVLSFVASFPICYIKKSIPRKKPTKKTSEDFSKVKTHIYYVKTKQDTKKHRDQDIALKQTVYHPDKFIRTEVDD